MQVAYLVKDQLLKLEFFSTKNIIQEDIVEMKNTIDRIKIIQSNKIIEREESKGILKNKSSNIINNNNIINYYFDGSNPEIIFQSTKYNNLYEKHKNENKLSSFKNILNDQIEKKLSVAETSLDLFLRKFSCLEDVRKHFKNKNWDGKYGAIIFEISVRSLLFFRLCVLFFSYYYHHFCYFIFLKYKLTS